MGLGDDGGGSQSAYSEFDYQGGREDEEQYSEFEDDEEVRSEEAHRNTNPREEWNGDRVMRVHSLDVLEPQPSKS